MSAISDEAGLPAGSTDGSVQSPPSPVAQSALKLVRERLEKIIGTGPFAIPGGVLAVSSANGQTLLASGGSDAAGRPVDGDDLFPLASASKLATGLLILRLIDRDALSLDASIGEYLPDAGAAADTGVTIRRLLSHTAGMGLEIGHEHSQPRGPIRWQVGLEWPNAMANACLAAMVATQPGTAVQYSNIGFGLLALAAERVTGRALTDMLEAEVFQTLGIEAYIGQPPKRDMLVIGDIPGPLAGTPQEPYNSDIARNLGAPWAGVISNARGLLALVRAYGERAGFLSRALAAAARTDQTGGVAGGWTTTDPFLGHGPSRAIAWNPCPWGLAVEIQGGKAPHWAPTNLPNSFGQIGSSGCLAWYDPASDVAWAVLGARTTESGWLLRHGARIAQTAIQAGRDDDPRS